MLVYLSAEAAPPKQTRWKSVFWPDWP